MLHTLAPTRRDRRGHLLRNLPYPNHPHRRQWVFPWNEIEDQIDPNDIILDATGEIIGITYHYIPPVGTHPANPIDVDAPQPGDTRANPIDLTDLPRTPTPAFDINRDLHHPRRGSACTCYICRRGAPN